MQIPYSPGHDYYTPFYVLATLTNVLLLLWEGWRRGFPLRAWLTLVAASSLALILGSKLITHSVGDWAALLFTNAPADTARSILGGSLAAVLTVVALRRWLGLGWAVLDALALPLCAALVVQCVGCVLTGCCFGEPTMGSWGLTYAAGTHPWAVQLQAGLLPATAAHSLPVMPTQLMALLLCAAVGGVLLATRRRRWPVGSWLLLQTGLLLLGRFAQAFWRDAASEPVAGQVHGVLGGRWLELQLWLLPLGLLALGLWAWRVRRTASSPTASAYIYSFNAIPAQPVPTSRYLTVLVALLGSTAALSTTALTPPETMVVRGLLLAVLGLEAVQLFASGSTQQIGQSVTWSLNLLRMMPARRVLPLGLATAVFGLTSQVPASDSVKTLDVAIGGAYGGFTQDAFYASKSSSGCDSAPSSNTPPARDGYQHRYRAAGGQVAYQLRPGGWGPLGTVGLGTIRPPTLERPCFYFERCADEHLPPVRHQSVCGGLPSLETKERIQRRLPRWATPGHPGLRLAQPGRPRPAPHLFHYARRTVLDGQPAHALRAA
jgi:prolipoprotein diacylglyceryltransferase